MRIAIDATALYGRYGGVQYAVWNLLFALGRQENEHEYIVYVPVNGPPLRLRQKFSSRWQWRFLSFKGEERVRRIAWQQLALPSLLKRDRCDLLYSPTYVAPVFSPVPVVLTVFDIIALEHPEFATRSNRIHYQMLLPLSLRRAKQIAVPSDSVRQKIGARFGAKVLLKTHVVPLGLEPLFFKEQTVAQIETVREKYQLPQRYFLFVGNREPKKNVEDLVAAYQLLKRHRKDVPALVLAGGPRPWKNQQIAIENVHEIGYIPRRHLPALYAGSIGLVFPTLAEGFGLPVLEALACGAPVITTNAVPISGVERVAQIVDLNSPEQIASAMENLLDDPELINKACLEGPNFAAPFTWKRAAEQMLELFTNG
ncbi:MAG: glycosyltransferase family 1 protein [Abditibacteriaceae bacterium]